MPDWLFLISATLLCGKVYGQLPPPENLRAFAAHDGVLIRFEPVDGAVAYLGVLGAEESSSVESPDPQLYFGDLDAMTEYTVFITAIDENGIDGEPGFLVFTTGVGEIKNFKVVTTSSSLMTLEWDPIEGIESYIIDPVEDKSQPPIQVAYMNTSDTPSLPSVRMTGESSARITGLRPMTYYRIAIRGVLDTDLGPTSSIRARTDGNGVVLYNIWTGNDDKIIGGTGAIFKPLQKPDGPYTLIIDFPCELERFEVWDALVDANISYPESRFPLLQDDVWMQEKNEIGFNFYTLYNESWSDNCDFDPSKIIVLFGEEATAAVATEEYDIPYEFYDWGDGGMMTLKLSDIFRETRQAANESDLRQPKPDRTRMAIQINLGDNCSAITIKDCWNVDRVYNATIDDSDGSTYYFVQTRDMWFTNNIGFVVMYDPAACTDRENFQISFLSGGTVVKSLQDTYELQEVSQTCSDDPFRDPEAVIEDESLILF